MLPAHAPLQAPLPCWTAALTALKQTADIPAITLGYSACKAAFTAPKTGRKMQKL